MFSHFLWECAVPDRDERPKPRPNHAAVAAVGAAIFAATITGPLALAGGAPTRAIPSADSAEEIDTEDVFGFIEGADIGHAGEQEAEIDAAIAFRQEHWDIQQHRYAIPIQVHGIREFPRFGGRNICLLRHRRRCRAQRP
jgi:hypothetical protein